MDHRGSWRALNDALRKDWAHALAAGWGVRRPALLRPVLLAGLSAALAGACSSAHTVPPAQSAPPDSAVTAQTREGPAPAAAGTAHAADGRAPAAGSTTPEQDPAFAPAPRSARPAREPHPYGYLWKAASAGNDPWPRREALAPSSEPSAPGQEHRSGALAEGADGALPSPGAALPGDAPMGAAFGSGAANAPEVPATGAAGDESLPPDAANGRPWSEQDLAELAPYLHGIASWYGPNFHGKLTANGETYNQYGLTAAHPVLPIGTRILVENLDNGRRVWLRVNDRGPYAKGRILDLSRIAAERLGMIELGTAPVRITVLKWPETVQASFGLKPFQQYTVQSAAYPELDRAEELRERLQSRFPELPFFVEPASNGFFAVAAGPFDGEAEAKQVSRKIHRSGLSPIVRRYRN